MRGGEECQPCCSLDADRESFGGESKQLIELAWVLQLAFEGSACQGLATRG
jgi:hypothetical protein